MTKRARRPAIDPVLQAGLDHLDQGITVFDREMRLVAWNCRFLELLDFPAHLAFVGADRASFVRFDAARGAFGPVPPPEQAAQRVAEAWRPAPRDDERVRQDGTVIRISDTSLPGGGLVTVYTDVTAQKEREAALERRSAERAAALRLSEARLKIIANEMPAGIVHVDEAHTVLYANRRFAKAYGYDPEQMVGLRCTDVLSDDAVAVAAPYFEEARRGSAVDFEMRVTLPDGRRKDIRTFLRPEQPARRGVVGFYILSIDITRQKAANAALLQSQKMDALGRLSAGIAHDFNNLLTIIIGNLAPLRAQIADAELRADYLEPAIAAAERGSGLTRRLLTLARRQKLAPARIDTEDAVLGLVRLLRASMPETIEIIWSSRGRSLPAFADPAQFEMALLNLAMNARDAIRGAGEIRFGTDICTIGSVEAETLKIRRGRYVQVRVADSGVGMTREQREHIFEPFYTSKGEGVGAGLGLAMVYAFVRQSNGAIRVESDPGRGSAFTILLPVAGEEARAVADPPVAGPPACPGRARPLTLLVDDDAGIRGVLRRQLVASGHPLIEAGSGEEALSLMRAVHEIGLVITDIGMPGGVSGVDLAREIRTGGREVGIVLMTGHGGQAGSAPGDGDVPILRKPFEPEALDAAIRTALNVASPGP